MIILKEGDALQGCHMRVSWELFTEMLQSTQQPILGLDEYIHAVRFEGEGGIMITIRDKEGTHYEDDLH